MSRRQDDGASAGSDRHLSTLDLDGLALGALDADAARRAESHLVACAACRREADALRASREHFTASVLPRTLPGLRQRVAPRRPWWRHAPWIAAPVLAAAIALLLLRPGRDGARVGDGGVGAELGVKGGAALQVVVRRGERTLSVVDGTTLAAGDQLRFVVGVPRASYLLIASVDGSGATTVYYPYGGSESARIEAGPRIELPASIVLDAAPGPERIVAIWSSAPVAARDATAQLAAIGARGPNAIRTTTRLDLAAYAQLSVVFEKSTP